MAFEEREVSCDIETEGTDNNKAWLRIFNTSKVFFLASQTMAQIQTQAHGLTGVENGATCSKFLYSENKKPNSSCLWIHSSVEVGSLAFMKKIFCCAVYLMPVSEA
jgi:hypothetical protein